MEGTLCHRQRRLFHRFGSVGWAWQVRAMSSAEAPNSMATHLADHLADAGADDVDAEDAVGRASASTFTMPSVS